VEVFELELWRDQIVDFMAEMEGKRVKWTVMGNSIGGLLSLLVSAKAPESVRGKQPRRDIIIIIIIIIHDFGTLCTISSARPVKIRS